MISPLPQEPTLGGWRKSKHSDPEQSCVEVGGNPDARVVGVRDTKSRTAGTLRFSANAWAKFLSNLSDDRLGA